MNEKRKFLAMKDLVRYIGNETANVNYHFSISYCKSNGLDKSGPRLICYYFCHWNFIILGNLTRSKVRWI